MQIEYLDNVFVARIKFSEREIFRRAGWFFDPRYKKWTTVDILKVLPLKEFTTGTARVKIELYDQGIGKAVRASMATDSDMDIPMPDGSRQLFPFQRAGVEYGYQKSGVLIADPPGLGKSAQSICIVNTMQKVRHGLIICPASLKKNWTREWKMWTIHKHLKIGIVTTETVDKLDKYGKPMRHPPERAGLLGKKIKVTQDVWPEDCDIHVINKELFERHEDILKDTVRDFLIIDEAHVFCNEKAKTSMHIWGGGKGKNRVYPILGKKRIFLTGTPITTRPRNLWAFVKALDPRGLGANWFDFHERYCGGEESTFGYYKDGATHLEELNVKLRAAFMVRRDKKEVLKDLPPKTREIILLPNDGLAKQVERELTQVRSFLAQYESDLGIEDVDDALDYMEDMSADLEDMTYSEIAESMENNMEIAFAEMSAARKALALAKAPLVKEHVDRLLETGEKVILFCYHKEVAAYFKKAYSNMCAFVTGATPSNRRQDQVDMFQEDPDCRVFIGNIAAAGVGFTLTAASIVVFAEISWVPSELEQAEDRAWRIGQLCNVLVQHLVIDGSIDARMIEVILERIAEIERALDAKHVRGYRV